MKKVIYFDGVCNLCHWMVRLLIRIDHKSIFLFAPIQSDYARKHLLYANGEYIKLNTVVYQKDGQLFSQSDAVLEILNDLGGLWKVLLIFRVIPVSLRDKLYQYVATRRYGWFGKKESCMLPTENSQRRFLE